MKLLRRAVRAVSWFFSWLFEDLKQLYFPPKPPSLPEDSIPVDKRGVCDLSFYTEPLEHYIELYNSFLATRWKGSSLEQRGLAWKQRVHGTNGLLVRGREALPFLLTLIRHSNPDAREDAYFLLGELRSDPAISKELLECLQNEKDLVARSAVIAALGKCRYRPAIPALRSIILGPDVDADTRWDAADSLGSIVGQDFSGPDKLAKAQAWLADREE